MTRCLVLVALAATACSDDAPGESFQFSGGYMAWDSTFESFVGIGDATVADADDPSNSDVSAPNGRTILTLRGSRPVVTFDAAGHLPGRYTVSPEAAALGLYEVHGITEAEVDGFLDELGGLAWDDAAVMVQVEVRAFPSLAPADGVTVSIGGAAGYHRHEDATWSAGATVADGGAHVLFPNVEVPESGELTLEIDADGWTCHAVDTIDVVAGEMAMTTVGCEDP